MDARVRDDAKMVVTTESSAWKFDREKAAVVNKNNRVGGEPEIDPPKCPSSSREKL